MTDGAFIDNVNQKPFLLNIDGRKERKSETVGRPVFDESGRVHIDVPQRIEKKKWEVEEEKPEKKQVLKEKSRLNRMCKYCQAPLQYNTQTVCDKCKERRLKEIYNENLKPILEEKGSFRISEIQEIDFPLNIQLSIKWYLENGYLTRKKDGKKYHYYLPENIPEPTIPGISKECRRCGEIKSMDEFYRNKKNVDGYASYCKDCDKKRAKLFKQKHQPCKHTVKEHVQGIIIDDMKKINARGESIQLHLHLLTQIEKYQLEGDV